MSGILARLIVLCLATAAGGQLAGEGKLRDGVELAAGLLAAETMLEVALALPGALFY